jgi:transposase
MSFFLQWYALIIVLLTSPLSPDLNPWYLFLWAIINDNVYVNKPDTKDYLKENTYNRVFSFSKVVFERVMNNVFIMFDGRLWVEEKQFQRLL